MGVSFKGGRQNFNFLTTHARQMKLSGLANMKIKGSPQSVPPKFKICYYSRYTDENFRIDKYKLKIKYDKIWGYQNVDVSLKRGCQNSKLVTTHA